MPEADDDLLSVSEVARKLAVSEWSVRDWERKGLLPFVRFAGTVRIRRSDLNKFLGA